MSWGVETDFLSCAGGASVFIIFSTSCVTAASVGDFCVDNLNLLAIAAVYPFIVLPALPFSNLLIRNFDSSSGHSGFGVWLLYSFQLLSYDCFVFGFLDLSIHSSVLPQ